jgi:phosphate transport system permease protein
MTLRTTLQLTFTKNMSSTLTPAGYYQRWRLLKDKLVRHTVVIGGLGIIGAIVLIFFYLLYAVFPLFLPAQSQAVAHYSVPEQTLGKTLLMATEEQNEVGVRFTDQGKAIFFAAKTGKTVAIKEIAIPATAKITSFVQGDFANGIVAYGLSNGQAVVVRHSYNITYPNNVRVINPDIEYPMGKEPLLIDKKGKALEQIAFKSADDVSTFVAKTKDQRIILTSFEKKSAMFGEEPKLERVDAVLKTPANDLAFILINKDHHNLYLASRTGLLSYFDISDKENPVMKQQVSVLDAGVQITAMDFLNGDLSVLIGDSQGSVSQWSMVRDEKNNSAMQKLRAFKVSNNAIVAINPEARRKGFITADDQGQVGIYYTTSERELIKESVAKSVPVALALSPRANGFLMESANDVQLWSVSNEHPEVSWKALWQKVWYESYAKPDYIWQSSSASNDFEPKMSLVPLVFGTLKAAFYAMLIATPLALMGAIYTAYFMAPAMRLYVKPGIELMGALPTVILGFLAGLWLAPIIELHLAALFSLLMFLPLSVMIFAYGWQRFVPKDFRERVPAGWDAAILIPVILIGAWLSIQLSAPIENIFFNGNLRVWFKAELGIGYDQRNALIVGLAMGFAVIPTVFSIAEDAIFSVPKHLTVGSLALGATPWQTMIKVVLLTASPGIFSAIMIGLGRAIGETMIVLMATGNTPVMDLSMFQGMRTLSANIGVEMPESEVDSTHYRVLFLAALVLFTFTFVFNTLAELVRQRLRQKYSSL